MGADDIRINEDRSEERASREVLAADKASEDALHTAGQRKINLTWEYTQAAIAIGVVIANVAAELFVKMPSPLLANAFFLVIGFYFGRTNHARIGDKEAK